MIQTQIVDFDPVLKRRRTVHYDPIEDNFILESETDVTDVIEANKRAYDAVDERARWGDVNRVASIPMTEYYRLKREGIIDAEGEVQGEKDLLRVLQDPANLKFRTRPGRLI